MFQDFLFNRLGTLKRFMQGRIGRCFHRDIEETYRIEGEKLDSNHAEG